jgi:sec-independent protein translocase protein TatA
MFSIADMAVAGAVALLLFGPDQLPKVARRAGQIIRDVQNTSQSFIREMERAADEPSASATTPGAYTEPAAPAALSSGPAYHETPAPASHELVAHEAALETRRPAGGAVSPESSPAPGQPAQSPPAT